MISYIRKAALQARTECLSYASCKQRTYTLWLSEYESSKCAKYNTLHQQQSSMEKSQHIIENDWVIQHILVSSDRLCAVFREAFELMSSFDATLRQYIRNLEQSRALIQSYTVDENVRSPFIWITRHPSNDEYVSYHFPVFASYIFFCTHMKRYWAALSNVPVSLRNIPILPNDYYTTHSNK